MSIPEVPYCPLHAHPMQASMLLKDASTLWLWLLSEIPRQGWNLWGGKTTRVKWGNIRGLQTRKIFSMTYRSSFPSSSYLLSSFFISSCHFHLQVLFPDPRDLPVYRLLPTDKQLLPNPNLTHFLHSCLWDETLCNFWLLPPKGWLIRPGPCKHLLKSLTKIATSAKASSRRENGIFIRIWSQLSSYINLKWNKIHSSLVPSPKISCNHRALRLTKAGDQNVPLPRVLGNLSQEIMLEEGSHVIRI